MLHCDTFPFPRVPVNSHSGCEDVRRLSWPVVKVMSRYVTGRHAPRDQWHGQLSDFPKLGTGHVSVRAGGKYPECMCHSQIHTIIVGTVQSVQSILQEPRNPWFGSRLEFPLQLMVAVRQVAAVTRPATELERKVTRHV